MKNLKVLSVLLCVLIYSCSSSKDQDKSSAAFSKDTALPFPGHLVTLTDSWVKEREQLNTAYLRSLDSDRLLHNFRENAGLPTNTKPLDGWEAPWIGLKGHFTGHYLSAASFLVARYGDSDFLERINYMVDELYKCQMVFGNGYLSAFPERDFDVLESQFGGVWAPYYTYNKIMQGLLDAYIFAGNQKALDMVKQMAAYVKMRMSKLDEETIEKVLYSAGANPMNEAGAMNEVLYKLYAVTNDSAHLELAQLFDRDWFLKPMANNENILSGLHSNTHIVLVNGFAEAYPINNNEKYRNAVINFWDMLINYHVYANGSSSGPRPNVITPTSLSAEHWGVPGMLSNTMTKEIAETCVSHNTQKISKSLFSWTADPKYADAYMNTFYNSIMALQSARSGKCVYHLPLGSPRQKQFLEENDFHCCNGSSIEAFAQLNSGIYFHHDSILWINMYIPSKLNWAELDVEIEQTGDFPHSTLVEFNVSTSKERELDLRFFIPSWAHNVTVSVNDEIQNINTKPESFLSLNQRWNDQDKISLSFEYDFHLKTMPDDENVIALFYGPVLLAFKSGNELILKGDHESILANLVSENDLFYLNNNGSTYTLKPLFEIEDEVYGVYATIRSF
ncbi:glycoside hydrolase family 127 protein [Alkalitalea saponilacus]|uniref:DUF1680 family protein n=1 Tax=Alkalitalea saponilacus TaxID=889453 RepID=A0A1T5AA47_9BACT|nr:beta-L-arabinofuranosidase domain-containing protein [Alkalitalea saponilacus]ASB48773.1 hypothetical protein CDL62_06325 [Alkalitalea saponilacus]SKB31808.1 hypothetical protein SAMN03080601_00172 [Alkalitalea saponilacus]